MSPDRLINILVTLTLFEMMITIGVRVTFSDVIATAKNYRLMLQAGVANYLLVPAAAVALLLAFQASPAVSVGFLVLAVCPGAPYGPPFTAIAKGNEPLSVGLMIILAGSSAVISPLLLSVLLPWLSTDAVGHISARAIVGTLLLTQLLPLVVGLLIKQLTPALASRLQNPLELISKIMNLAAAGLILAMQFQMLVHIRLIGFVGMLALLFASVGIGWLAGGSAVSNRRALALTTSLRNVGVSLVIVTSSFGGTPAVPATLAYGIVEIFGALLLAFWWGKRT